MRVRRWMIVLLALFGALRRRRAPDPEAPPIVAPGPAAPRAELAVIALLVLAAACAAGFVVAYALSGSTQLLGVTLGGALALIAAALIVTGKRLVVSERLAERYPEPDPEAAQEVAQIVRESGSRLTRKRLLAAAAGAAGGTLGVALLAPAVSLGPVFDASRLAESPWRRGRRLVDENGAPLLAADVEAGAFYTAFPEGANPDELGSPLVVVRLDPAELRLPPERRGWAPEGIVAYSKICTHAGCAIALYRSPKFPPTEPRPALVCPCHYSTFDPAAGAAVRFGPAGRPLPQLPLAIDSGGALRASGGYSGPVGPGWSRVRSERAG
jgi:ubiquinol-cytochrome c reductase iron-sulfur subunit